MYIMKVYNLEYKKQYLIINYFIAFENNLFLLFEKVIN